MGQCVLPAQKLMLAQAKALENRGTHELDMMKLQLDFQATQAAATQAFQLQLASLLAPVLQSFAPQHRAAAGAAAAHPPPPPPPEPPRQ